MTSAADLDAVLDVQGDVTLILAADGTIEKAGKRARTDWGVAAGDSLLRLAAFPGELRDYLVRCSGTSARCVGAITLLLSGASVRFRTYGSRLPSKTRRARVLLCCTEIRDERFSILTRRIQELNGEIRKRRHLQLVMEEMLKERELLLREVHHRVKNNVQMLAGLLSLNERESPSPETKAALADVGRRVRAMGAFHQVLYQSEGFRETSSTELIAMLVDHVREMLPATARIDTDVEEFAVSAEQALPLSLLVNELATNAAKHGLRSGGAVTITFRRWGEHAELRVHNPGPAGEFDRKRRKGSGLGLVAGLARQLRGSFDIELADGVTCRLRYKMEGVSG